MSSEQLHQARMNLMASVMEPDETGDVADYIRTFGARPNVDSTPPSLNVQMDMSYNLT